MPDEIMGVVPNSINVPLLLASIILSQYSGSELSDETMPYNGIWLMIKKISSVNYPYRQHYSTLLAPLKVLTPVHMSFWLNGVLVSGAATSGSRGVKGFMRSRKRTTVSRLAISTSIFGVLKVMETYGHS